MKLGDAVRAHVTDTAGLDPVAARLAALCAESGGDAVSAVLFYGSRKTGAAPDPWSAYDFFVLTSDDRAFYREMKARGQLRRSPGLVAALNGMLPPNQVSVRDGGGGAAPFAKCSVIRLDTLEEETSPRRRDHFCAGRLFQPTTLAFARDATAAARVAECAVAAHRATWEWVRPWLPPAFDAREYCLTALRVSLGREIRPEPSGRADALFAAQRDYLVPVYQSLLEELAASGALAPAGEGRFAATSPVERSERRRIEAYFRRSKARATTRWFKYMFTFDDWLEYIVRKAERHGGEKVELSARERRWPLVFLWPRVFDYLKHKDRRKRP